MSAYRNPLYLGVYWQDRRESSSQCASRLAGLLRDLQRLDCTFDGWFEAGRTRREALDRPLSTDVLELEKLLLKGRIRRDVKPRTVMENLGFGIQVWTGKEDHESAVLMTRCGAYPDNPNISNSCTLRFPVAERWWSAIDSQLPIDALMAFVRRWEPNWGVIRPYDSYTHSRNPGEPLIGPVTYLSDEIAEISSLQNMTVIRMGSGTIVFPAEGSLDFSDPRHLRNVDILSHSFRGRRRSDVI